MISLLVFYIYSLPSFFVSSISCIFLPSASLQTQATFVLLRTNQPQKIAQTQRHSFAIFSFLDADNQVIMKQPYHITKTCKTSFSEELIFRETGTRKIQ